MGNYFLDILEYRQYLILIEEKKFLFFRFVDAVLDPTIRTRFLHLPTQQQQLQNMQECYAKYKLPNITGGIDGCHIPFLERPRQIPGGRDHVAFINRKGMYSINAQIVGGIDRKIYDIQLSNALQYSSSSSVD